MKGWMGVLAASLVVAGCGYIPDEFVGMPFGAFERSAADHRGHDLLNNLKAIFDRTNTMYSEISVWEQAGSKVSESQAEMWLAKPMNIRARINESDRPFASGSQMVYTGGDYLIGKLKGVPIKKKLHVRDKMVLTLRGYSIVDSNALVLVNHLGQSNLNVEYRGLQRVLGKEVEVLSITPAMLPDLEREEIGFDPETQLPVNFRGFVGSEEVFRWNLTKFQLDVPLSRDFFDLDTPLPKLARLPF